MLSNRRAVLRALLGLGVVGGTGFGPTARAFEDGDPPPQLVVLPIAGPAHGGSVEVRLPFAPTHLGLTWRGSEDQAVEIRWMRPGAAGAWHRLPIWHDCCDHEEGLVATGLVRPDPGATHLAVRWLGGVTNLQAVVIDAGVPVAQHSAPQPEIITRAGWGADEGKRKGPTEFAPISKLIVHHTVTPNNDPDPAQTVRAIYAYHTGHNGWNDIGYNFLVDQQGRVYEGRFARNYRPGEAPTGEDEHGNGVIGAHAKAVNPGTAGVAVLGDYSGGVEPPGPALDGLVRILAWKAARHDIDPRGAAPFTAKDGSPRQFPNIAGHRDVGETGCPGGRLYVRLPEIRQRVAESLGAPPPEAAPAPPPPLPPAPAPLPEFPGFWTAAGDGRIRAFGDVKSAGDLAGKALGGPIVSLTATPAGRGYWMAGADGGVFAFGDAPFAGAPVGQLRSPAIHIESTPSGKGYWVLTAAGEVFAFGDASFRGQMFPIPVHAVGLAPTPSGQGYWIATADAQVFAFGDAVLQAATGPSLPAGGSDKPPPKPTSAVAIAASPDGKGYWLLGRDGGVFSFGVPFHGSVPDRQSYGAAVDLRATDSGAGYYVAGTDGAVFAFGDADRRRERGPGPDPVVDIAFRPTADRPAGPPAPAAPGPPAAPAPPPSPPQRAKPAMI
jgi:hypothetical protein